MNNSHPLTVDLQAAARQTMLAQGFEPDFPADVAQQLAHLPASPPATPDARDLRNLLWSSVDNDTSRDLDQIEYAERLPDGSIRVLIGIADVDAFAPKDSAIDRHAAKETTSIYTGVRMFPMLPEQLSTGVTSLLENEDRLAIVTEYTVRDGHIVASDIYRALVRNKFQLTYSGVGPWLEGKASAPDKVQGSEALQAQLKLQDEAAQALRKERYIHGALDIESTETTPILTNGQVTGIANQQKNRASQLIEDFMIAANEVVARFLLKVSSIRRIVKTPERWDRMVQLAAEHGDHLPAVPDSKALNDLLTRRKAADPDHFADLSLTVVKLMGPGEYVLERPGDPEQGHFGLAVQDYTHSTAPNRRYADLITQRILKSVLAHAPAPYTDDELAAIARNCTLKEDAARKVEREMTKRIAAVAMQKHVGETFDSIVTGANAHGTFVRVLQPHIEGMLTGNTQHADVGDRVKVRLVSTDAQRGYIDFARI